MSFPFCDPAQGVSEPPGDFRSNYRQLKQIIENALRDGTPLEELHLIPKDQARKGARQLSKEDLLSLLRIIRRIKTRYQRLLQSPVPEELERDILGKSPDERLPWEQEALDKVNQWRQDVQALRAQVQKELNDHLNQEFFRSA